MSIQKGHQQSFSSFNNHFFNTFNPYLPQVQEKQINQIIQYHNNFQYYEEFKKLYFTSFCIDIQCKRIQKTKQELLQKIHLLEEKFNHETKQSSEEQLQSEKQKRFRRKADDIERKFVCSAERCGRNYGSEGSLQQHIKLKHPEVFKKEQNCY